MIACCAPLVSASLAATLPPAPPPELDQVAAAEEALCRAADEAAARRETGVRFACSQETRARMAKRADPRIAAARLGLGDEPLQLAFLPEAPASAIPLQTAAEEPPTRPRFRLAADGIVKRISAIIR